jgi:DNA-directed RNA polymerase specialized sigma24 family protein
MSFKSSDSTASPDTDFGMNSEVGQAVEDYKGMSQAKSTTAFDRERQKRKLDRVAYSAAEIAVALGCSPGHVRNELARGRLAGFHSGRRLMITRESFENYMRVAD